MTGQLGQKFLMMVKLTKECGIVVEQQADTVPAMQQPADPNPRDQPHAEFDTAGPVNARQKWIVAPPGAKLPGNRLGIDFIAGDEIRRRHDRKLMMARRLPDILHRADLVGAPIVDIESIIGLRRPHSGPRIEEPIRIAIQIVAHPVEKPESAGDRFIRRRDDAIAHRLGQ